MVLSTLFSLRPFGPSWLTVLLDARGLIRCTPHGLLGGWSNSVVDPPCGIPLRGLAEGEIPQGKQLWNANFERQTEVSNLRCIF